MSPETTTRPFSLSWQVTWHEASFRLAGYSGTEETKALDLDSAMEPYQDEPLLSVVGAVAEGVTGFRNRRSLQVKMRLRLLPAQAQC
ncbi:hypothetical protein ACOMHN_015344 [Nucella lapillus]